MDPVAAATGACPLVGWPSSGLSVGVVTCRIIVCDVPGSISLEGSENVRIPGVGDTNGGEKFFVAGEDAGRLAEEARKQVEEAIGVSWYDVPGGGADRAATTLCLLRRAAATVGGGTGHGDDAVRRVLEDASPVALTWIASRAISYMDENGYPELIAPWLEDVTEER
jgi:hypothetical protein